MAEEKKQTEQKKKRSLLSKLLRIFAWIIGSVIFLVILVLLLIQLPAVQNYGRKKVVSYLQHKLDTKVEIGKLDIKFPTGLSLQNVFFEDQSKDTLLYGKELAVNLRMLQLLKNNVEIKKIYLDGIVAKVKRLPPDSTFNFQFIVDAFASENEKEPETQDTSTLKINIDRIEVENSHVIYDDAYTGNDMDLHIGLLDFKIDRFDPTHLLFDVPQITLENISGHFYQLEPLQKSVEKSVKEASVEDENVFQLFNKEISLSKIDVVFKSDPAHLATSLKIGDLKVHPETLDLKNYVIKLKDASLKNSDFVVQTQSAQPNQVAQDTTVTVETPGLQLFVNSVKIENTNLQYDDQSAPKAPAGMDFSHLAIADFNIHVSDIFYSTDTIEANVKSGSFKEKSGFELTEFTTDFQMIPTGISLQNLVVKTPQTTIQKYAVITYPSLDAIKTNPGNMGLDIDLENSKISLQDVHKLMPALSLQSVPASSTLYVDARITGSVDNLNLQKVLLRGLSATDIAVHGIVKGLPDANKMFADLNIDKFNTSRADIFALTPPNTLPANITIPEKISASGAVRGSTTTMYANLTVNTTLGGAKVTGTAGNLTNSKQASYNVDLKTRNLQVGTLIQNPDVGSLTADVKVKGKGTDPQTANAAFQAVVSDVTLKQYHYRNLRAEGSIRDREFNVNAFIHDPNIDLTIDANGIFAGQYPSLKIIANIDSIKTQPLHLTDNEMIYHGVIDADFATTNPDSLDGALYVTHSIFVNDGKRITLDSLSLVARNSLDSQSIALKTDFLNASLSGRYTLTELGDVFQNAINPYFSITDTKAADTLNPYSFSINASVVENATITTFLPDLKRLDPINITGNFDSDSGWNLYMISPRIEYGTNLINDAELKAGTQNDSLKYSLTVKEIKSGTSVSVFATTLSGALKNDILNFFLNIKDPKQKDKYILSGNLQKQKPDGYVFSLNPGNLMLDYDKWNVNENNMISYINNDLFARDFILSQDGQQLSINSTAEAPNSPLRVDFKDFKLSTLTSFVQQDSLMINGLLNGNAVVKDLQTDPVFTTDLTINNLSMYGDTLGNLTAKVDNQTKNIYNADIALTGFGNDIKITGDYKVSNNSSFDIIANINQFQMSHLEGLTNGAIINGRGFLYGKVAVNGTTDNPNIDGNIRFNSTAFNVSMLNNVFKIDKEAIAIINNEGIKFNRFTIRDTTDNPLIINGSLNTTNFTDYTFDLGIRANHFQVVNSTNKDNDIFYGRMVFSTNLTIKGSPAQPIVDGSLTVEDATDFTFVLPQEEPGVVDREGIVRFVDYSATAEDSLFFSPYDSLDKAPLTGYDVSMNLNIDKNAVFNLIVDQGNGDFLRLKGTAELNGGIDPSGKISLTGSYEIEEGGYNLTFNFLKRNFEIQKGSRIVWTGEPTTAQADITAIYVANTAPLDLVKGQITGNENIYKQKLPFEVHLQLAGEIMKPQITFDIVLPEEGNYNVSNDIISTVQNKLLQLRQEPGEMNKQVFALLLLNRFVGENPFDNSSGGSFDAETFAKQSVSKLLSEQLNSLAEGLIEGVDINFDLATTEDYTTGNKEDRTDLNVGVSKRLLNDRLTVTVGSNFELEGPRQTNQSQNNLAGNININYKLSKDGRYALRAYRKNDYTGTIEGYVIETGIGFTITLDYNRFSEIFRKKADRRKNRAIRRRNRELRHEETEKRLNEKQIKVPSKARQNEEEED